MKKILLVTEEHLGNSLFQELSKLHAVDLCFDTDSAIHAIGQNHPDALVLQLGYPDVDGIAVLEEIHYQPSVILVITTFVSDEIMSILEVQGVAYLYTTPCKVSSVVAKLNQLLGYEFTGT